MILIDSPLKMLCHEGGVAQDVLGIGENPEGTRDEGAGVLATGWEFPDALMANSVPYISATTDSPSIKVNGVVEPYV